MTAPTHFNLPKNATLNAYDGLARVRPATPEEVYKFLEAVRHPGAYFHACHGKADLAQRLLNPELVVDGVLFRLDYDLGV